MLCFGHDILHGKKEKTGHVTSYARVVSTRSAWLHKLLQAFENRERRKCLWRYISERNVFLVDFCGLKH